MITITEEVLCSPPATGGLRFTRLVNTKPNTLWSLCSSDVNHSYCCGCILHPAMLLSGLGAAIVWLLPFPPVGLTGCGFPDFDLLLFYAFGVRVARGLMIIIVH